MTRPVHSVLADMSHELRTPLNAILGFAQLLRHDRTLGPEHQTHAEVIYRSGEQLLALISDLLELSRHEPGAAPHTASFDLHQLLEDLGDMLYLRAERRGLVLAIVREPGLPRLVRADAPQLRQLLLLLLGHAIRLARHPRSPGPLDLRGGARGENDPALVEAAVDALVTHDAADLDDRLTQSRQHGPGCLWPGFAGQRVRGDWPQRRHPTTVASARAEAHPLGLQDEHRQRRLALEQREGRPQAGVAAAHDGDVRLGGRHGIPTGRLVHTSGRRYAALPPQRSAHRCASASLRTDRSRAAMSSNSA